MKTTLTREEIDYIVNDGIIIDSQSLKLYDIFVNYVDQSEHVFAFDMYYADPDKGMYGSDLVREFGPQVLDRNG